MKYVCIGIHATAQCKYWNYSGGWDIITEYFNNKGYEVRNISKEQGVYMGNTPPKGVLDYTGKSISDVISILKNSEMFIGVSSGLSWLAWGLGVPVVLISGFTKPWFEPSMGIERVFNPHVCNSCFNDENIEFDKGDWLWCPRKKDFECSRKINPEMVVKAVDKIIFRKENIRNVPQKISRG